MIYGIVFNFHTYDGRKHGYVDIVGPEEDREAYYVGRTTDTVYADDTPSDYTDWGEYEEVEASSYDEACKIIRERKEF